MAETEGSGEEMSEHVDSRWLCTTCGDLDYLDDEGLCRSCTPEPVIEWWQVIVRATTEDDEVRERRWRIG